MSTSCITSRLTLGPIASGALSELALNYNLRAEITASSAYGNGRFVGIPTTERNSLRLFEGDGFQLKRTVGKTQIDLRSAAQCVVDSLITSGAPEDLVKKLEDTLKVIDYVRASGDVITAAKISEGTTAEQATVDAHNIALILENALLLTVENTTVWGQVMPSAAFEVYDPNKCPDGQVCQTKEEAAAGEANKVRPGGGPRYGEGERAAGRRVPEAPKGGDKTGGGDKTSDRRDFWGQILGLGKAIATPAGGAATATVVVTGGLAAWFIHRRMARQAERETTKNTLLLPQPGAVTVMDNADGSRSFQAWESENAQGQRWGLRVQPYSDEEASDKLDTSRRRIREITINGTRNDADVTNPREQAELRVARGYVAQFGPLFPTSPSTT